MDLSQFTGFDWDEGNNTKNWRKHRVTNAECEEIFFNQPLLVFYDKSHSGREDRYYALGTTDMRRLLVVVFTARRDLIRVISARDMTRVERRRYEGA
ncbi:MAG: BrnT family toxin [Planctomycetes bacterium]|nr:BrnT family toxin [Planctomycetota bacterium]